MGSGPNTGLGELHIPDLQPGSSIMPGKVNPVVPEATLMVCARVIGNDATVAWAGASGSFELNVAIPVMGTALLESIRLLANTMRILADKTIDGLEANVERAAAYAGMSPSIVTPLNKLIGYEAAAKIAKHSVAKGITVREAVIDLGYVDRGEHHPRAAGREARPAVDDPPGLTGPGIPRLSLRRDNRGDDPPVPPDLGARPHPGCDPGRGLHRAGDRGQRHLPGAARARASPRSTIA